MKRGLWLCECGRSRPDLRPGCVECRALERQRNAGPSERITARMAMLDVEWLTVAEIADALEVTRPIVSDSMPYLVRVGAVEKRWEPGELTVYRVRRAA